VGLSGEKGRNIAHIPTDEAGKDARRFGFYPELDFSDKA